MSALICGSMAFDSIMVFHDKFRNHILPDKIHMLSVCFLVPDLRREYGGCAGNIAYNLALLGGEPLPMAAVGKDFEPYRAWLEQRGIPCSHIEVVEDSYTAQAFITTDLDDNQITAFHPGAMDLAHQQSIPLDAGVSIGMVAPDGREGMLEHARQFAAAGIPFIFDPGQGLPMFGGEEIQAFIEQASWVTVNDYEWELIHERTGLNEQQVAEKVEALIITRGARGSAIYADGQCMEIPVAKATEVVDPTGCGDAYRGGLLWGLMNGRDWETTGRVASLMGAMKVAHAGTQNHHFSEQEFATRFQHEFGCAL